MRRGGGTPLRAAFDAMLALALCLPPMGAASLIESANLISYLSIQKILDKHRGHYQRLASFSQANKNNRFAGMILQI